MTFDDLLADFKGNRAELWCELFEYRDGNLFWRVKLANRIKIGSVAGSQKGDGYKQVRIGGKWHYVHRIIYEMHCGDTHHHIDHIDRVPSNNKIENLREATHSQNVVNSKLSKRNTSGFKGVNFRAEQNRWRAQIRVNGKMHSLGQYSSAEEASAAYIKAAKERHGEFFNDCVD